MSALHPTVLDTATVRVSEPVRGIHRGPQPGAKYQPRTQLDRHVQVHPLVLAAAKAHLRPGQRLVLVSATEVRVVNR